MIFFLVDLDNCLLWDGVLIDPLLSWQQIQVWAKREGVATGSPGGASVGVVALDLEGTCSCRGALGSKGVAMATVGPLAGLGAVIFIQHKTWQTCDCGSLE